MAFDRAFNNKGSLFSRRTVGQRRAIVERAFKRAGDQEYRTLTKDAMRSHPRIFRAMATKGTILNVAVAALQRAGECMELTAGALMDGLGYTHEQIIYVFGGTSDQEVIRGRAVVALMRAID